MLDYRPEQRDFAAAYPADMILVERQVQSRRDMFFCMYRVQSTTDSGVWSCQIRDPLLRSLKMADNLQGGAEPRRQQSEYSPYVFPVTGAFRRLISANAFLHSPLQPLERENSMAPTRRDTITTSSYRSCRASYRTEPVDLAAAGCHVTTCVKKELDLRRLTSIHSWLWVRALPMDMHLI